MFAEHLRCSRFRKSLGEALMELTDFQQHLFEELGKAAWLILERALTSAVTSAAEVGCLTPSALCPLCQFSVSQAHRVRAGLGFLMWGRKDSHPVSQPAAC